MVLVDDAHGCQHDTGPVVQVLTGQEVHIGLFQLHFAALFTPLDEEGKEWRETVISGPELAVEDIKAADLDGDGRPDIVAAARQTKNLKIFFTKP